MIWILFALVGGLLWAVWYLILQPHYLWLVIILTVILVITALVLFILRQVRARRAATALERALQMQGEQQVRNAPPERRAEIQALQKQLSDGVAALKASKLGGKQRGMSALYALPWYAIIGPPGAGKTTALRHSGLVFPYADTAVRGVGGTRNCDWWFTNEAILLDTAGRYTTEHEDQQEWLAFLDLLRKYRSNKPLNGLIVAVAMPDIIDANEAQLEAMGKKLRARIDEVMTRLRMVLPVYFLITKCDLIAGFSEFFGDLRRSERAQAWGATLTLREDKRDPGGIFAREFDALVQQIHARACKRLAQERNRQAREAIFQFPLEFAGIKRNLQELLAQVFMVNAFQGTPIFRGVYFSSGTQEGTPLNRVLQRMGHAMGIRPAQMGMQPRVESKSYFLHDLFMRIVFPDADVAARSAVEMRRRRMVRIGVSAAALALALTLAIPSIVSFFNNRALLADSKKLADKASKIDWEDSGPIRTKLEVLDPLLERLKELDEHRNDGVPWGMRWLMYSGEEIYRPLVSVYVANMQQGFVKPNKYSLERQLNNIRGDNYVEERLALKTYLMLSDTENLDVDWATGRYTQLWADLNKATADTTLTQLKGKMREHVRYYFGLIKPEEEKKPRAKPVPANDKIVTRAREVLQSVPVRKRYYAMFVDSVSHELYDPSDDPVRHNLQYPPMSLDILFTDRPEVKNFMSSKQFKQKKIYYEVPGPYTDKGHFAVLANIDLASDLLDGEQWVVPLSPEERGDRVAANIKLLAEDYEQKYVGAWEQFMLDIEVKTPANLKEAAELYAELQKPEWPYLRVVRTLEDHTQWKKAVNDAALGKINQKLNQKVTSKAKGLKFGIDVKKIAGRASRVPDTFKKSVAFAIPQGGGAQANVTALSQYLEILARVRKRMVEELEKDPNASVNVLAIDLKNAMLETEALFAPADDTARRVLRLLLLTPLNVGGNIPLPTGTSIGGS